MYALLRYALLCLAPHADTLLPETPAEWRFERLEFPLSFAPGLDHAGFEELRFAPGMFTPGSDSYFSYVFAMRIEEGLRVDERFLQDFFQAYYAGLCRAVAGDRELELDLDEIATEVAFDGRDFVGTVRMVDAFTTGAALTLRLELSVHAGARSTELLGLASPLARDAPIWTTLEDVRARWRAARAPASFLNHVYVVPDAETYAALESAEFLRTFAVREKRTTVRTDMSYTGLYFYGDDTYFEFLAPSPAFPAGSSGVAFGFEDEGGAQQRAKSLGEKDIAAFVGPVTRELDGTQVPWFRMLSVMPAQASSRLNLFALEYEPRFLELWHADSAPAWGGIARRSVLERYAAALGQSELRRAAPFADVAEIHLAVDAAEMQRVVALCETFGYAVEEAGETRVCTGPGIGLVLRLAEPSRGITALKLALRHPVVREPLQLGRARLAFAGATALLELAP